MVILPGSTLGQRERERGAQKGRKPNEAQERDAAHPRRCPSLSPLVVLSPVTVFIPFVPRVGKCKTTLPVFDESEIWINWNHGANGKRFHVFVLPDFALSLLMSWFFLPFIFQVRMDRRKASTINIFHCVSHFFIFFLYLCLQLSRNIFFNSNVHFFHHFSLLSYQLKFAIIICYSVSPILPLTYLLLQPVWIDPFCKYEFINNALDNFCTFKVFDV